MEVSKLVYNLFTGRILPTYIGVIIHLLSTMDIPVPNSYRCCEDLALPETDQIDPEGERPKPERKPDLVSLRQHCSEAEIHQTFRWYHPNGGTDHD